GALEPASSARIGRPIEMCRDLLRAVVRSVTEQRAIVELRSTHDFAGIEEAYGIEAVLDILKRPDEPRPKHGFVKLRAHDAVAVLTGMRAFVGPDHRECFLGDGAHRLDVFFEAQIEHRPHMQAAHRGMGVPGPARAMAVEYFSQSGGVFGKVLKRHRAIFDERDRLSLLFHRHHDIKTGGAYFSNGGLELRIEDFDHSAPLCRGLVPGKSE